MFEKLVLEEIQKVFPPMEGIGGVSSFRRRAIRFLTGQPVTLIVVGPEQSITG